MLAWHGKGGAFSVPHPLKHTQRSSFGHGEMEVRVKAGQGELEVVGRQ